MTGSRCRRFYEDPQTIREIHDALDAKDGKRLSATELARGISDGRQGESHNAFLTLCEERALKQAAAGRCRDRARGPSARASSRRSWVSRWRIRTTSPWMACRRLAPRRCWKITSRLTPRPLCRAARSRGRHLRRQNQSAMSLPWAAPTKTRPSVPCCIPTHPDRVPGGSSGGSAAAVRAGLCMRKSGL